MRDGSRRLLPTGSRGVLVLAAMSSQIVSCSDRVAGPEAVVEGVVHLRDGPPLPGVVVSFFEPAAATSRAEAATTDTNGRFSLRLPGGTYEVWVGGAADSGVMAQQVSSVTVRRSHVSLDLHYAGYRVTGAMRHLNVALASGNVFVLGGTNTARAELRDNGAGTHAVRTYSLLLPAGTFDFWANPNEGYWGVPRVKFEGITVGADTTIDLAVDGHFVEGTVTGPGGAIVYGAIVSATAPGAEYEFHVTPPVADTLAALHTLGEIITAPRTLDFQLPPKPVPPGG